jgi:hypothetical protein
VSVPVELVRGSVTTKLEAAEPCTSSSACSSGDALDAPPALQHHGELKPHTLSVDQPQHAFRVYLGIRWERLACRCLDCHLGVP